MFSAAWSYSSPQMRWPNQQLSNFLHKCTDATASACALCCYVRVAGSSKSPALKEEVVQRIRVEPSEAVEQQAIPVQFR